MDYNFGLALKIRPDASLVHILSMLESEKKDLVIHIEGRKKDLRLQGREGSE